MFRRLSLNSDLVNKYEIQIYFKIKRIHIYLCFRTRGFTTNCFPYLVSAQIIQNKYYQVLALRTEEIIQKRMRLLSE